MSCTTGTYSLIDYNALVLVGLGENDRLIMAFACFHGNDMCHSGRCSLRRILETAQIKGATKEGVNSILERCDEGERVRKLMLASGIYICDTHVLTPVR